VSSIGTNDIPWLIDRLYEARRHIQAEGDEHIVFVLMTKAKWERDVIENKFFTWFQAKYGVNAGVTESGRWQHGTRLIIEEIGASILLLDLVAP
jgi:hypothetical protein